MIPFKELGLQQSLKQQKFFVRKWMKLKISGEDKKIRKILNIDGKFLNGMKNKNNSPLDIVSAYSKEDGICC